MRPKPDTTNKTWEKGVCKKKVAPRSYEVVPEGKLYRRNRRHLASTKEAVEDEVALPDFALETPNQPLQNDSPSTQENPPQEVTGEIQESKQITQLPTLVNQVTQEKENHLGNAC